jgi:hypothetical protein
MEMFAMLTNQLKYYRHRSAPYGESGKGQTGAVFDYLGGLLQGDAFAGTHASLLIS